LKLSASALRHRKSLSPPRTGVWIETCSRFTAPSSHQSPPRTGVWIETGRPGRSGDRLRHPLARGCGLKQRLRGLFTVRLCHPLARGCGLKQIAVDGRLAGAASPPRTGVWIETTPMSLRYICCHVTPSHGGVD